MNEGRHVWYCYGWDCRGWNCHGWKLSRMGLSWVRLIELRTFCLSSRKISEISSMFLEYNSVVRIIVILIVAFG